MLTYTPTAIEQLDQLMTIENACHSHPWTVKTMKSCIGGRYFGYFAMEHERPVGFYIGEYILEEATLMDICVAPEHQGKGFGKQLLEHFVNQAKQLGAKTLFLEVRVSNINALMLYINQGFVEISRRTGYYPSKVGYEDGIVMKKSVNGFKPVNALHFTLKFIAPL